MSRIHIAALLSGVLLTVGAAPAQTAPAVGAAARTHTLEVLGTDAAMYPDFAPGTERYGITTTDATAGTVTVSASTTDPAGTIWIDGVREPDGLRTLSGLNSGDEISVWIDDSLGREVHSLIYLPSGFPAMTVVTKQPGVAPGQVFLTLGGASVGSTNFETVVDQSGVPSYVRASPSGAMDLKRQPNGHYSVYRPPASAGKTGGKVVELDDQFQPIAAYETGNGLVNTDGHDSLLLANGHRILIATEHNAGTGFDDAVIQEQDADGNVVYQWSTGDHIDPATESVVSGSDYVHINSIWVMHNGDLLVSFRHLSAVLDIAWSAHGGFQKGDVVWRLGGRKSDFTFADDPYAGPCAQHTASQLPNGDIVIYDDGSASVSGSPLLCVNADDPSGPAIARAQSRVTEYSLDRATHVATLVWSYVPSGRFSLFAGSAQRLANGNTMVGWAADRSAVATEVDADGNVVWELKDDAQLFSYRSLKYAAPDKIAPAVDLTVPADGATYDFAQDVTAQFSCTDTGGASLDRCDGDVDAGAALDTATPGVHTFTVQAKDERGNMTTLTHTYQVRRAPAAYQPDGRIRTVPAGPQIGAGVLGGARHQHVNQTLARAGQQARAELTVVEAGTRSERFTVVGTPRSRAFAVTYLAAGRDVTKQVVSGTYLTPITKPGSESAHIKIAVTRTGQARPGNRHHFVVRFESTQDPSNFDAVATVVRATG